MCIIDTITSLLKERNISQKELCDYIGLSKNVFTDWKAGRNKSYERHLPKIASFFDVSVDYLLGNEEKKLPANILPMPKMVKKPRLGTIACGEPILAVENIETYDFVPEDIPCDFTLKCKGDSMINARIFDGDIVYIRQQDIVDDNEIAAVLIDDEATLKRVRLFDDHIVLEPANPMYQPLVFWGEDMNRVRILGKAVVNFSFSAKIKAQPVKTGLLCYFVY